jgi:hypothetical protein
MARIDKLIAKAKKSPQNLRFEEFVTLVTRVGVYSLHGNPSGSHWTFEKSGQYPITLTKTGGKAKVEEVKKVVQRFREEGLI